MALQGSQGSGDELRGQRVQDVGFLQLQGFQLSLDLLKGDAVQARIFVADGDKVLPEFSGKGQKEEILRSFPSVLICLPMLGLGVSHIILFIFPCWRRNKSLHRG